jgi:spermidine/putrescine transport system permease protein
MKAPVLRTYTYFYLIFLFGPIILLPIFAFNNSAIIAFPLTGFTTSWFEELWTRTELHRAVQNSLIIATITAVFSTFLGVLAARAGALDRFPGKGAMTGFIMLPLVLPEIILAVALLVIFARVLLPGINALTATWYEAGIIPFQTDLQIGIWTIVIAHILFCTPFATVILNGAFASLDKSLEEAAMDLGESRGSAFRLVTLPLIMPGIISAFLISFIISLDEFIIAFFLSGNVTTLPVYIYGLRRQTEDLPVIMALGTILVILSISLLIVAEIFRRRGLKKAGLKDTGGGLL